MHYGVGGVWVRRHIFRVFPRQVLAIRTDLLPYIQLALPSRSDNGVSCRCIEIGSISWD